MARAPIKIRVGPVKGMRVMRHDNPTQVIDRPMVVTSHPHYIRAIGRGELTLVDEKKTTKKKKED